MRTIRGRIVMFFSLGFIATAALGGCVTSQGRARYTAHRTSEIEAGPAANNDVALAFGLDGYGQQDEAFAQVDPN